MLTWTKNASNTGYEATGGMGKYSAHRTQSGRFELYLGLNMIREAHGVTLKECKAEAENLERTLDTPVTRVAAKTLQQVVDAAVQAGATVSATIQDEIVLDVPQDKVLEVVTAMAAPIGKEDEQGSDPTHTSAAAVTNATATVNAQSATVDSTSMVNAQSAEVQSPVDVTKTSSNRGGQHGPSPLDGAEADAAKILEAMGKIDYAAVEQRVIISSPTMAGKSYLTTPTGDAPISVLAGLAARPKPKLPPHVIVIARAGTGKTTTLIEGLKQLFFGQSTLVPSPQQAAVWESMKESVRPRSSLFAAFNNSIATELSSRVPQGVGCAARTLHSFGYFAIRKAYKITRDPVFGGDRTAEHVSELTDMDLRVIRKDLGPMLKAVIKLVSLCKQNLMEGSVEELEQLASHYDVELLEESKGRVFDLVPRCLERAKDVDRDGYVDGDDMIWIPVVNKIRVYKNDLIIVDEFQDCNRCQHALALLAGERLILCGDDRQSIYGFAGADSQSMSRMEQILAATARGVVVLRLTVTRRCGKAIVKEAQGLVPDFEAFETNPDGEVTSALYPLQPDRKGRRTIELKWEDSYLSQVLDGDMVLCRANAPLVNNCFRMLKKGRKAFIQGRDVATQLTTLIDTLMNKEEEGTDGSVITLLARLEDWLADEVRRENAKRMPSETRIQTLMDRLDCLKCFAAESATVLAIRNKIDSIFTDNNKAPGVKFSSIHRAKGLEAQRVFLLQGFGRPMDKIKYQWERDQEQNLEYVGITRAISKLTYVS